MARIGIIGVGKMGLSHLAIFGAHPDVEIVGIVEPQSFVASAVKSQTGIETYKNHERLIDETRPDAIVVATPSVTHVEVASYALEHDVQVFVEKPLTLSSADSWRLSQLAVSRGLANQVGYHNRFIGTFQEVARLVQAGAVGQVYHVDGKASGPVVTKPKTGFTWRSKKSEGGGCLHDYASHVVDLMNFVVGPPKSVVGARLHNIYSKDVEDAVYALFDYAGGFSGQLETNWSDETHRKMSTTIAVYGSHGKILADRQELQVFLKKGASFEQYPEGWTTRYITDLQAPVSYYLRGEEYSAQVDAFVEAVDKRNPHPQNSFESAYATDWTIDRIIERDKAGR
ncbi:MAG: Gfo/Idh/MocA family oxidoreductase [Acidimicrobiales bacterium]|nr:Gfo/Idh/MocA family oxidoreductase [Acidimicrobiales bacterium]MCB9392330.1 Gfo/Idh/MocA family oxidoreductase [Acidimicrobiaceae bacterium]